LIASLDESGAQAVEVSNLPFDMTSRAVISWYTWWQGASPAARMSITSRISARVRPAPRPRG